MISFKTLKITIIFSLFFLLNTQLLSADEAINTQAQSDETSLSIISNNENSLIIEITSLEELILNLLAIRDTASRL